MFRRPAQIEDDIEWLEGAVETAEQYTQDIYDVVSTVRQVHMLEHNRAYIDAIKAKIEQLRADLKESKAFYSEDEDYE
ncbi:MAG: hypothetical protein ACPGQQ_02905 [Candidatus Puniceispirillaceae bacterium]